MIYYKIILKKRLVEVVAKNFAFMSEHRSTSQKKLGGNEVLPKFRNVCPNHDFLAHYVQDKKIVWDS